MEKIRRDKKGRFIKKLKREIDKKYVVKCPDCGVERIKTYKDLWAINNGITTARCKSCSRFIKGQTNSGGFKKGNIPYNKGKGKSLFWERIKNSKEWKEMREAVFERDDYTCQICKVKGGILHPDHILPKSKFPELTFILSNIRTLCKDCHKKTDTYGGKAINYKLTNY